MLPSEAVNNAISKFNFTDPLTLILLENETKYLDSSYEHDWWHECYINNTHAEWFTRTLSDIRDRTLAWSGGIVPVHPVTDIVTTVTTHKETPTSIPITTVVEPNVRKLQTHIPMHNHNPALDLEKAPNFASNVADEFNAQLIKQLIYIGAKQKNNIESTAIRSKFEIHVSQFRKEHDGICPDYAFIPYHLIEMFDFDRIDNQTSPVEYVGLYNDVKIYSQSLKPHVMVIGHRMQPFRGYTSMPFVPLMLNGIDQHPIDGPALFFATRGATHINSEGVKFIHTMVLT